jgi:enoyl-CoA hydratase/carnithine racemase
MDFRTLRFEPQGRAARAILSGREDGNRLDRRCLDELGAVAEAVEALSDVCVLVISAEGPDFCLGWDQSTREEVSAASTTASVDAFGPIARLACPVVAAMQGRVTGAGLELALACDIRVASDDARFSHPEPSSGLLPLAGATQRLPRVVGRATALEMLLLGGDLDAQRAYRCGLVSRVVPRSELEPETEALIQRLASRGPLGLRYAKEAVQRGMEMNLQQGLLFEADLSIILQSTSDRAEGVRAFLEKREPRFEGR